MNLHWFSTPWLLETPAKSFPQTCFFSSLALTPCRLRLGLCHRRPLSTDDSWTMVYVYVQLKYIYYTLYIIIYVYTPRTQMTLVLVGKGLVLRGLNFKNRGHWGSRCIYCHLLRPRFLNLREVTEVIGSLQCSPKLEVLPILVEGVLGYI